MQIYSNFRPFPIPSLSLSLFSPLLDSIARTKVQKLSLYSKRGGIEFLRRVIKTEATHGREREQKRGTVKMQAFFSRGSIERDKGTAGVEIMTLNAAGNFAGAA